VSGSTTLINCNISNNTTTNTVGHAILLYPPGSLSMTGCTVANNTGNQGGAAVDIRGGGGGVTNVNLTNCTISGNNRGGLITPNTDCTINITNVTITDNESGFQNYTNKCTMKNTILAGNTIDLYFTNSPFLSGSNNNIMGNAGASGLTNGVNGNQIGVDPKLLALASNGGFTQTHALSPCSPAINAGTSSGAPSTDQRGSGRVGTVDIGSFEYQSSPTTFSVNTTPDDPACSGQTNGSISVSITGGGVSPFTYAWSGTGTGTNPRTGLAAGTYTVTVTDAQGCTGTRSTTLTAPSVITIGISTTNVTCNGANDGTINLTVTGGTGGYNYNWSGTGTGTDPRTNLGPGTYTVTVTDANGCTRTAAASITQPSLINIIPAVTNSTCGSSTGSISLTVSGGTGSSYTYSWTGVGTGNNPRTNLSAGTYTVTVTDVNGCTRTSSSTVSAPDNTPPSITCPSTQTLAAGASCTALANSYTGLATASDNCSTPTVTQSPASGTTLSLGANTITLTATDASNNTAACTFTANVTDITAPTITCPANVTVNASALCNATLASYTSSTTASDNCTANPNKTQSPASGTSIGLGPNTITMTATDNSSNLRTCTFTVTVRDVIPPTMSNCPANTTVSADANGNYTMPNVTGLPTVSDNCTTTPTRTQSPTAGTVLTVGPATVTITAMDAAGNSISCAYSLTVNPGCNPPTITCPTNKLIPAGANCMALLPNYVSQASVTGGCGTTNVTQSPVFGTNLSLGAHVVTLTVFDSNGSSSACTFTVTIVDQTPPSITCPANTTVAGGSNCTATLANYAATVTATDNCTANPTETQSPTAGTTISGTQVVTLTAGDAAGNSASCSFSVSVTDNTTPSIVCPGNVLANSTAGQCSAVATFIAPVGTDNCPGVVTIQTTGLASGATFPVGTTTNTFRATDAAGNTVSCAFTVTINDNQVPTITCPLNIVVGTGNFCNAVVVYTSPVGTDNCSGSITVQTAGWPSGTAFPVGVTTNLFRVTDASGNTASCTFTVTVTDQTPPTVTCPANTTVSAGANCAGILGTYSASATDNCTSNPTPVQSPAAGTAFTGSQVVTFSANDAAGNTGTCTFTVIVGDQTAPGITCPANTTVAGGANCSATLANYAATVTATDNCSANPNETQSPAAGTTFTGAQVVTLTATDAAGNTATCSFLAPVIPPFRVTKTARHHCLILQVVQR
jgi:hypothetical protein